MFLAGRPAAAVHKRGAIIEERRGRPRRGELTLAGARSGKSTAIRELVTGILARGNRLVVAGSGS